MDRENLFFEKYKKYRANYELLLKWMFCDCYGRKVEDFFADKGIKTIAIYGAGELGVLLLNKLKGSSIDVACFIDAYSNHTEYGVSGIKIVKPENFVKEYDPDAILITVTLQYTNIEKKLLEYGVDVPILSLEQVIMTM